MILAFSNDYTVTVFDNVQQANSFCERVDVEDGVYVFIDEQGFLFIPHFATPVPRGKSFGLLPWVGTSVFTLEPTEERRVDLLANVFASRISVERGPTSINSMESLRKVFRGDTSLSAESQV